MDILLKTLVLGALLLPVGAEDTVIRVRPTTWAQPVLGVQTGNFYQVSPEVYRSEQPDDDHVGELKKLGIRSVLSLRQYHSDEGTIADPDIRLFRVKMNAGEIVDAEIQQALTILQTCPKPVLVHCWHGSDRTGVVIAAYRIRVMNWERQAAIDEMMHGGFGHHGNWYPNIERYLKTMAVPERSQPPLR